jgi:hypothetical protein
MRRYTDNDPRLRSNVMPWIAVALFVLVAYWCLARGL